MAAVIRMWSPNTRTRWSPSQWNLVKCLQRSQASVALMVKNKIVALRRKRQVTYRQNKETTTNGLTVDTGTQW